MIRLQRLLVPTDFSESARHALVYACSFAQEYDAEVLLLHVVETLPVSYATDLFPVPMAHVFQEITGYAEVEMGKLVAETRAKVPRVRSRLEQGRASEAIVRVAREEATDMIVLGTHGRGILEKALFGSTTDRVVRLAPCPVLTTRLSEHEFV